MRQFLLIQKATSLYRTTHALTSSDSPFRISFSSSAPISHQESDLNHAIMQLNNDSESEFYTHSHSSIAHSAMSSLIEKGGSIQCHNLLNEMEKGLVSRAQAFDLLVSAFLFFACIERLEWAFRWHEIQDKVLSITPQSSSKLFFCQSPIL